MVMATTMATTMMIMRGHNNNNISRTSATDSEPNNNNNNNNPSSPAVFHDFLSGKVATFNSGSATPESSSLPAASDLASERQVGGRFERVSSYGPKIDLSVAEMSNQFVGKKRSNSDSAFMSSSREGFPQRIPENSHVMKMLRSVSGGERPRVSQYEGPYQSALQMRPGSASFMLQTTGNNASLVKSERPIPMNMGVSNVQYNTYIGQASSLSYQMPLSRSRDGSFGPSVLSQLAADEGSRTGKGSGILSSINADNVISERNPSALMPSGCMIKPAIHNPDPESSNPPSRCGLTSSSRQMTIIYGGQVHVFDDVHPNKADVIMALAGSSGGSWCTILPKSSARATTIDSGLPMGENETSILGDSSLETKYQKILSVGGKSNLGLSSNSQGGTVNKGAGTPGQAVESNLEAKREV